MGKFYLLLSLLFVTFRIIRADCDKIPEIINFSVLSEKNEEIPVSLVATKTYLANENVPVWIPDTRDSSQLTPLTGIMDKLTPFTVYWDPSNCAAALYYHKRKEFDGNIGHRHFIWKLKYNPETKKVEPTDDTIFLSPLKEHNENRLSENEDVIIKRGGNFMRTWTKSLINYPKTVYVETLVMVDYGIVQELEFDYTSIVSYVLTLLNSVDLIYSKIETPNIRINIAGIIIGSTRMSFQKLYQNSCFEPSPDDRRKKVLDGLCAINALRLTLDEYHALPAQSYDTAIFLTNSPLLHEMRVNSGLRGCYSRKVPALGLAALPNGMHGYRLTPEDIGVGLIGNPDIFRFLPTAAHEMAHLLGVPHDEGPLWTEDGTCDAHLMKKDHSYCKKCFKFGGNTPEHLKRFFGSRESCTFHNEPRSLNYSPGPRAFWDEDQQCKCYGYKMAYKPENSIRSSFRRWRQPTVHCETRLKCINENNQVDETAYYMDGTPCSKGIIRKKVCWNNRCSSVRKGKVLKKRNRNFK